MNIPVLTYENCAPLLNWRAMVDAIRDGHQKPKANLSDLFVDCDGNTMLTRSAFIEDLGAATKSVTVYPNNPAKGLSAVNGLMILFDEATGLPVAILDNALVTPYKTVADSMLGTSYLKPSQAERVFFIGAGAVIDAQISAYRELHPEIGMCFWARDTHKASEFSKKHEIELVESIEAGIEQADIVVSATHAVEPIIKGAWLHEGQHLDLIGAFRKDMREADDDAISRARVFVDSYDTTISHIGEIAIPIESGVLRETDIEGDLYSLVAGRSGRQNDKDITIFKNGGGAHLDLMIGRAIYDLWKHHRM